ncbi:hypothetical protein QZH41_008942, partial [Actinostola sp. cb2023]
KPLKIVEKLGYTPAQYKTALEKLDLKFGGERRLLQRHLEAILETPEVLEGDLKELEIFSDRLTDIVAKLKDYGHRREIVGVSALYTAVQQKIPETLLVTYQQWAHDNGKEDGLSTFVKWLAQQVVYRTTAEETKGGQKKTSRERQYEKREYVRKRSSFHSAVKEAPKCILCQGSHTITACKRWEQATTPDRWRIAKQKRLCYRCLGRGHDGRNCQSKGHCNVNGCQGTHHFHLHYEKLRVQPSQDEKATTASATTNAAAANLRPPGAVLLRTVPVTLIGGRGQRIKVNAFLDDGSDTSYLRSDVATALGLHAKEDQLRLSTLTDSDVKLRSKSVEFEIESLDGKTKREVRAWTMSEICQGMPIPDWNRHKNEWNHLKGIPFLRVPGRKTIDILIGSDYPELALALEERIGRLGEPVARRTPLGWTCVGRVADVDERRTTAHARTFFSQDVMQCNIDEQLRRMWDIDSLGVCPTDNELLSPDERLATNKAIESRRKIDDRYEIAIPWKEDVPTLPDNRKQAESRLLSLETSLKKKPQIAERYKEVMDANIKKGYIQKVEPHEEDTKPSWYLPHFPVVREDKQTTKVRIVYDSAAKYEGICLNDVMLTGPKLQRDILEVLLSFRQRPVALVADIKEMFCQVLLAEKDRRYHRLLWRDLDDARPPDVYEAAPPVVLENMYMDDVLHSAETEAEAIKTREQLTELLSRAGFEIRRWCSNKANVLKDVPEEDRVSGVNIEESELPNASQAAYAAVTYIRYEQIDGNTEISFVAAKAKVTPIKAISIPRLELMATVMGVRLLSALFYTDAEYRIRTGKTVNIQNIIEQPELHFIARCGSSDSELLLYSETRHEVLDHDLKLQVFTDDERDEYGLYY